MGSQPRTPGSGIPGPMERFVSSSTDTTHRQESPSTPTSPLDMCPHTAHRGEDRCPPGLPPPFSQSPSSFLDASPAKFLLCPFPHRPLPSHPACAPSTHQPLPLTQSSCSSPGLLSQPCHATAILNPPPSRPTSLAPLCPANLAPRCPPCLGCPCQPLPQPTPDRLMFPESPDTPRSQMAPAPSNLQVWFLLDLSAVSSKP